MKTQEFFFCFNAIKLLKYVTRHERLTSIPPCALPISFINLARLRKRAHRRVLGAFYAFSSLSFASLSPLAFFMHEKLRQTQLMIIIMLLKEFCNAWTANTWKMRIMSGNEKKYEKNSISIFRAIKNCAFVHDLHLISDNIVSRLQTPANYSLENNARSRAVCRLLCRVEPPRPDTNKMMNASHASLTTIADCMQLAGMIEFVDENLNNFRICTSWLLFLSRLFWQILSNTISLYTIFHFHKMRKRPLFFVCVCAGNP